MPQSAASCDAFAANSPSNTLVLIFDSCTSDQGKHVTPHTIAPGGQYTERRFRLGTHATLTSFD